MDERALQADDLATELAEHLEYVRRMARALVRDDHIAEDVVQETMMAAVAHRPSPSLGLRAWLASVLRRRVLLHFRTEQRRTARETLLLRDKGDDASTVTNEAARAMESIERGSMLGTAVADLPELYRTVVVLRFFDGLSPVEISDRLDRPVNTINTQLQRGLARLRESLDDQNGGDRRAWVVALLPHALHGPKGWWPASVGGLGGLSYGALASAAGALLLALASAIWFTPTPKASGEDTAIAHLEGPALAPADTAGSEKIPAPLPASLRSELQASDSPTTAALDATDSSQTAGEPEAGFRLTVRSSKGPLEGALVTATERSMDRAAFRPTSSEIQSPDGVVLTVTSTMESRPKPAAGASEPRTISTETNAEGLANLPILDGGSWAIQVKAEGLASKTFGFHPETSEPQQAIELGPAARLVIDRGSFPLDFLILVQLRSQSSGEIRTEALAAGVQDVTFHHLPPGAWILEAMSDSGPQVGHWRRAVTPTAGLVTGLDLSEGGAGHTRVELIGGSQGAAAQFVQIQGIHRGENREWSYLAPVRDGAASFHGLPPGPAIVKARSTNADIARAAVDIQPDLADQRLELPLHSGSIRVLHAGIEASDIDWQLAVRSELVDSPDGWAKTGAAEPGDGESVFFGCAPGEYRLWMFHGGSARRFDIRLDGALAEIDASPGLAATGKVNFLFGSGMRAEAPIELELYPGAWRAIGGATTTLELPHGQYRARAPFMGLGFATRSFEIPADRSITLEEEHPRIRVPVAAPEITEVTRLLVAALNADDEPSSHQRMVLVIDGNGACAVNLRPGRYLIEDSQGKSTKVDVGATPSPIELILR